MVWMSEARIASLEKRRGVPLPEETRAKISATLAGRPVPERAPDHYTKAWLSRPRTTDDRDLEMGRVQLIIPTLSGLTCVYCGVPAEARDHVVPFSRGGRATAENIVPACHACNHSKAQRTPDEWLAAGLYR